jgi:sigma-B regulation protein RsbU (phosphoserine phosphatase)
MNDLSERRILIVDDVKANVDVLVHALRDHYKLSVSLDGAAALASIKRTPPDLVLLDVMMPGIDGYEVCRRIRGDPTTSEIPVMFLTSLDEVGNKMKGFEAGGTDYVVKPFEILEVQARVRSLLEARAYAEAKREIVDRDLKVAREIQLGMVPSDFSRWKGSALDAFALLEPAREVGGDLYTVFPIDDRRVFLAVGDVSGKGIPAALLMAVTMTLVRTFGREIPRPQDILDRANVALTEDNQTSMFVTLLVGILDLPTGRLVYASGGHTPPVVLRPGEPPRFAAASPGTVLGQFAGIDYEDCEVELRPGDTFVAYTDGVTEAFDPDSELFGDEGLLGCLGAAANGTARETVDGLLASVRAHARGAPQSDDIAIVALRYAPKR